jgi:hypothetical protein
MLRKIHGTNFFLRKFLGRTNIKCQNGPAQVFCFNGQALIRCIFISSFVIKPKIFSIVKQIFTTFSNLTTLTDTCLLHEELLSDANMPVHVQYDESLHGGGYMEGGAMYHEHRLSHPHLPPVHYPPPAAPAHALPGEPLVHKRDKDAIYG